MNPVSTTPPAQSHEPAPQWASRCIATLATCILAAAVLVPVAGAETTPPLPADPAKAPRVTPRPLPPPPATNSATATNASAPVSRTGLPVPPGLAGRIPSLPTPGGQPAPDAIDAKDTLIPSTNAPSATAEASDPSKSAAEVARAGADDIVKSINFNNMPIDQILDQYSLLTGRTVLRPSTLTGTITLKTQGNLTRKEVIMALESVMALNGITLIPRGEKFVKAVLQAQAVQEAAEFGDGKEPLSESEGYVTQIVQLKNAKPTEVVPALTPFAKNPQGIVGIDSSQIIVLRDYSANVKRMLEVLKRVDVVPELDYKLEVIPIRYGKVEDIYNTMSSLISGQGGATGSSSLRSSRSGSSSSSSQFGTGALQNRNRSVTQPNGGANNPALQPNQNNFQNRLNQLVNRASSGSETQLLTDAKIIPDERSNSLIVFANKQDLQMITNIVAKVDTALAQVLIEAIILEVTVGDNRNLGVSYLQRPQASGKFTGAGGVNNGQSFINPNNFMTAATSNATSNPVGVGNLPSGFSYFGTFGNDFDMAVTAIAGDSNAKVMSRPRIVTSHAVAGNFFVGDTVPYITGSSYGYGGLGGDPYGGTRSSYTQLSVGIQLDVTPFITPDGLVVMDIQQNIEQLGATVKIDNNDVPTTVRRTANATISVRDRDTIMLGGFINQTKNRTTSGVPGLMNIPGLGALFRSRSDDNKRVELIVLMRPVVLHRPQDAAIITREEIERLPGIAKARFDIETLNRSTSTTSTNTGPKSVENAPKADAAPDAAAPTFPPPKKPVRGSR